ncbi:hypothetical protein MPTK1_5g01190 [Marchantia polymorpha subsp. ruderalis]
MVANVQSAEWADCGTSTVGTSYALTGCSVSSLAPAVKCPKDQRLNLWCPRQRCQIAGLCGPAINLQWTVSQLSSDRRWSLGT